MLYTIVWKLIATISEHPILQRGMSLNELKITMLITDNWNGTQVLFYPSVHLPLNAKLINVHVRISLQRELWGDIAPKELFSPKHNNNEEKPVSSIYMIKYLIQLLFIYSIVDFQPDQFYSAIVSPTLNSTRLTQMAHHYNNIKWVPGFYSQI